MSNPATASEHGSSIRNQVTSPTCAAILDQLPPELAGAAKDYPFAGSSYGQSENPRVPVFRGGRFSGFIERNSTAHAITCNDQGDAELQCRLTEAVSGQDWLDPDHVGIAVENRVVRLSGRGDSTHAVLALRRLAASAPCVAAIIDDLWIDCE